MERTNLTFRIATERDAEQIAALSEQLGYHNEINEIRSRLSTILNREDDCIYVAEQDDNLVGWIHGFHSYRVESAAFVEIGGLVVHEHSRNTGIGKQLIEIVDEWARTKNCKSVRVRCNVKRIDAHRFYERIGFALNKEQKIFAKRLNE